MLDALGFELEKLIDFCLSLQKLDVGLFKAYVFV